MHRAIALHAVLSTRYLASCTKNGTFAFAMLSSAIREASTSKEKPLMFRLSVLLLIGNIGSLLTDILAFDEETEEPASYFFSTPTDPSFVRRKALMRFASKHVVATALALVVHYSLTAVKILHRFVRWRLASLPPATYALSAAPSLRRHGHDQLPLATQSNPSSPCGTFCAASKVLVAHDAFRRRRRRCWRRRLRCDVKVVAIVVPRVADKSINQPKLSPLCKRCKCWIWLVVLHVL